MCRGRRRFRLLSRAREADGLNVGDVEWLPDASVTPLPEEFQPLAQLLERVLPELGALYENMATHLDDADWVGARLAEILPIEATEKQKLLEEGDPVARLVRLAPLLRRADEDQPTEPNR
jgi:uncharacterized protein